MAQLIGFGGPIIFIIIFLLINNKYLKTKGKIIYSILIYVLSLATGIGLTVALGFGSIFSGIIAPIFYTIVFTLMARNKKLD